MAPLWTYVYILCSVWLDVYVPVEEEIDIIKEIDLTGLNESVWCVILESTSGELALCICYVVIWVHMDVCARKCLGLNMELTFLSCTAVDIVLLFSWHGAPFCLSIFVFCFFSSLLSCCIKAVVHRFVRGSVILLDPYRESLSKGHCFTFYRIDIFTIIYESVLAL